MTKDFGINAGLVSELAGMYLHDRNSVDDQWKAYLDELIGGGDARTAAPHARPEKHPSNLIRVIPA